MAGISTTGITYRLKRGMTVEQAVETPVGPMAHARYAYRGKKYTIPALAKKYNIPQSVLKLRISNGATVEDAIRDGYLK